MVASFIDVANGVLDLLFPFYKWVDCSSIRSLDVFERKAYLAIKGIT